MSNDAKRAAVYVRVSTQEQAEGTSLDVQRQTCRSYATGQGWTVVGEFADEGVSGTLGSRPGLDELVAACRAGGVDVVVVHRLDRFGRSLRHLTNTLAELDDLGTFCSTDSLARSLA
jgi:DNA invertase Pin-like site-specific DNA recombinase